MSTINHIGISGGKDSTALLLWAVHESGYDPETIHASFADTGNEAPETYDYIRMLSENVHPIEWLKPERDFYELAIHKQFFPSAKRRFCTTELKLKPMKAHVLSLQAAGNIILLHSGVRANESMERSKLTERGIDSYTGLPVYRPLFHLTLDDIWAMHTKYGIYRNPLYDMGMSRVGCFPCCMSNKKELLQIQLLRPERVQFHKDREAEVNKALGNPKTYRSFFHASNVPRSQRTLITKDKHGNDYPVATIEDVMRWATTSRGGQQYQIMELLEDRGGCWSESGVCE